MWWHPGAATSEPALDQSGVPALAGGVDGGGSAAHVGLQRQMSAACPCTWASAPPVPPSAVLHGHGALCGLWWELVSVAITCGSRWFMSFCV